MVALTNTMLPMVEVEGALALITARSCITATTRMVRVETVVMPPPEATIVRLKRPKELALPARIVIVDTNEDLPEVGLNETVMPDGTCCEDRLTMNELWGVVLT